MLIKNTSKLQFYSQGTANFSYQLNLADHVSNRNGAQIVSLFFETTISIPPRACPIVNLRRFYAKKRGTRFKTISAQCYLFFFILRARPFTHAKRTIAATPVNTGWSVGVLTRIRQVRPTVKIKQNFCTEDL